MSYTARRTAGQENAPLIFTFHGTGATEDQFHGLAEEMVPGAHVVSPRGDVSEGGALRYFRRMGEGVYDMDDLARRRVAMAEFMSDEIARTGATDIRALGYSNGANILAAVLFDRPELVGRAALLHPLIPWIPAPQPGLAGRRILITAGESDPICPWGETLRLETFLEEMGAKLTTAHHPGGHEIRQPEVQALAAFIA